MNHDPEAILTLSEVAAYLKVSPSTAWRWCKQGRIPGFQIGRSWRVKQCDLDSVIDQSKALHPVDQEPGFSSNLALL
jgi:excisionase family DNA binding protein